MRPLLTALAGMLVSTLVTGADKTAPQKVECRLPAYRKDAPALRDLNLSDREKAQITALSLAGRKIDAVLILRQCRNMSLREQKTIVDALSRGE